MYHTRPDVRPVAAKGRARLVAAAAALAVALPAAPAPRHVVLLVGDGMSRAAEVAASRYLTGRDDGLAWHRFEYQGFASTWDVDTYDRHARALGLLPYAPDRFLPSVGYDVLRGGAVPCTARAAPRSPAAAARSAPARSAACGAEQDRYLLGALPLRGRVRSIPATDSASAATALATGVKTVAGNVAWAPGDRRGGALATIAERARRERCAAIGIVTTVPFSHATPAAFLAHATTRDAYVEIAREMLAAQPEVIVGGGNPERARPWPFVADRWMDPADWAAARRPGSGWTVVGRTEERGGRALLRAASDLPRGQRLLALFGGADGAFERAVPATDGSATVRIGSDENPSLADAATAALTVLARDPDGFFLLAEQGDVDWATHAGDYAWMVGALWDLDGAVRAIEAFVDRPGDAVTWENTLVVVTADHANGHLRLGPSRGKGVLPARGDGGYTFGEPGTDLPPGHTNELVTVAARGAGAKALFAAVEGRWYPGTRIVDNTHVHEVMLGALGLEATAGAAAACR
jgi:alkaline phosphatase